MNESIEGSPPIKPTIRMKVLDLVKKFIPPRTQFEASTTAQINENLEENKSHQADLPKVVVDSEVVTTAESEKSKRQLKKEWYQQQAKPLEGTTNPIVEVKTNVNPEREEFSVIKSIEPSNETFDIKKEDFPWIGKERKAKLSRITIHDGRSVLYLDLLQDAPNLFSYYNKLEDSNRAKIDRLLLNQVPNHIERIFSPDAKKLSNSYGTKPLFHIGTKAGLRVAFAYFTLPNGQRTIVRVAGYDKSDQVDVLSIITSQTKKTLKYRGRV